MISNQVAFDFKIQVSADRLAEEAKMEVSSNVPFFILFAKIEIFPVNTILLSNG